MPAPRPAPEPVETLESAAERIARHAPVLGGLKPGLIDVAKAAGAFRRTLIDQGFSILEAQAMVTTWHEAHWADVTAGTIDASGNEIEDDPEPA